jgi:hypothetical protein
VSSLPSHISLVPPSFVIHKQPNTGKGEWRSTRGTQKSQLMKRPSLLLLLLLSRPSLLTHHTSIGFWSHFVQIEEFCRYEARKLVSVALNHGPQHLVLCFQYFIILEGKEVKTKEHNSRRLGGEKEKRKKKRKRRGRENTPQRVSFPVGSWGSSQKQELLLDLLVLSLEGKDCKPSLVFFFVHPLYPSP